MARGLLASTILAGVLMTVGLTGVSRVVLADEAPEYRPEPGVVGNLTAVGSDTLSALVTSWASQLRRYHPGVRVQLQAAGSSTAPPALIAGTTRIGLMSRPMRARELQEFESKYGYPPLGIPVALDAMGIIVHRDNPLQSISLEQLDGLFSSTHDCGSQPMTDWRDVGLTGQWAERQVSRYGRSATSGTYGAFRRIALCGGDFRLDVSEQPGSASIIQAVGTTAGGIGYTSFSNASPMVRQLPISITPGKVAVSPSRSSIREGRYPLTRPLYIYINRVPEESLPRLVQAFLSFVMSRQGQRAILREGYVPLPDAQLRHWRDILGLDDAF